MKLIQYKKYSLSDEVFINYTPQIICNKQEKEILNNLSSKLVNEIQSGDKIYQLHKLEINKPINIYFNNILKNTGTILSIARKYETATLVSISDDKFEILKNIIVSNDYSYFYSFNNTDKCYYKIPSIDTTIIVDNNNINKPILKKCFEINNLDARELFWVNEIITICKINKNIKIISSSSLYKNITILKKNITQEVFEKIDNYLSSSSFKELGINLFFSYTHDINDYIEEDHADKYDTLESCPHFFWAMELWKKHHFLLKKNKIYDEYNKYINNSFNILGESKSTKNIIDILKYNDSNIFEYYMNRSSLNINANFHNKVGSSDLNSNFINYKIIPILNFDNIKKEFNNPIKFNNIFNNITKYGEYKE